MKKLIFILFTIICTPCIAQDDDDFARFQREQETKMKELEQSQNEAFARMEKEYENYVKAEQEAYNNFVKKMEGMWGKGNVAESTPKDWVEYSNEGKTRSIVDFEKGEATVQVVLDPEESPETGDGEVNAATIKKLEMGIKELLTTKGTTKDFDSPVEKAVPLQETPVLENQVATPSGEIVTQQTMDESVKEIVEEAKPVVTTVTGSDGKNRKVVTVKLDLVPDNIRIRAEKYQNEVEKYCKQFEVEPALAFAIMQTESSFNPKAKSHVPAYGLMQIVPASAGADCAKSLKKPFAKPTANYLYEPENNVEMGVHYLYLLKKRHYAKVIDKDSQTLCIIASYNTGAGNVARAMGFGTNISKAVPTINDMGYSKLFEHLENKLLPETQSYIRKVTERMNNFKKWMN